MGLRERVTIALVIIALTQIACRHCMPRTPRKASLKHYLNDLKPFKNNPVPYTPAKVNKKPKQTFGKTQNGRTGQNSLPKNSLHKTFNFPENEYPLDNFPRDPFRMEMSFNQNNHLNALHKARDLQSTVINNLKKERKMQRKLLNNKQVNNENIPLKTDMSSIKIATNPDSIRLLDSETFPEVQYPLNTMETWGTNYRNYLPQFTQENQFDRIGGNTFNSNPVKQDFKQPFKRLTKAKASKFLQSYDKLKEEHRRTSTENSKRSNVGQKGLNFTKTATCEKDSDDFITAGLVSTVPSNSKDVKKTLESNSEILASAENTCLLIEHPYDSMPLPYKVIEDNENVCPAIELKNNTRELEDSCVIVQTLRLIEEILLNEDTSTVTSNDSKQIEHSVNTTETDYSDVQANKDLPTALMDSAETSTVSPTEEIEQNVNTTETDHSDVQENKDLPTSSMDIAEISTVSLTEGLSQEVPDDAPADILPHNEPSLPEETIPEPLTFTGTTTCVAGENTSSPGLNNVTTLCNGNAVPGYTSIIIIPVNNDALSKSQSHMYGTKSDTPIVVYLPTSQSSDVLSQTSPLSQILSSSLINAVPNNALNNVLSNMAPVQNDNPSSTALVSELPNSISDSGSSLPIHETLPKNATCDNNENSPSSMRMKPTSEILTHESLNDGAILENPKNFHQPVEIYGFDKKPDTLPQTLDFEHPIFDFADSDITSLSHGPNNNVLNNELPITAREIYFEQQTSNAPSKDIPTQNTTSEHLHESTSIGRVSDISLSGIPNDVPTLDQDISTDSQEMFKNMLPLDSLPNLILATQESISQSPIYEQFSKNPQIVDATPLTHTIEAPTVELPLLTESSLPNNLLSETLSDNLSEIRDAKVSPSIITDTSVDSIPQPIDNTLVSSPNVNVTPITTDMSLKDELFQIRQILDKMLSSGIPINNPVPPVDTIAPSIPDTNRFSNSDSESPPMDTVLLPISDSESVPLLDTALLPTSNSDSLSMLENETVLPIKTDRQLTPDDATFSSSQTPTDSSPTPVVTTLSPTRTPTERQPTAVDTTFSSFRTPIDTQPAPDDATLTSSRLAAADRLATPVDTTLSPAWPPTERQPTADDTTFSSFRSPTDTQPAPDDATLISSRSPADRPATPVDTTLSPTRPPTVRQPTAVDTTFSSFRTPTETQPAPDDATLTSSRSLADRPATPVDTTLSPTRPPTVRQPTPVDTTFSPTRTPTERQSTAVDTTFSFFRTPTDTQPAPDDARLTSSRSAADRPATPVDTTFSPTRTPTDRQPTQVDTTLSPTWMPTDRQLEPVDITFSPTRTPTDRQPTPVGTTLPTRAPTDRQPTSVDTTLSPTRTPSDIQPIPVGTTLSPTRAPTDRQPTSVDTTLSSTRTPSDIQPTPVDTTLSPTRAPTDRQPTSVDTTLSSTRTPSDLQPTPVDTTLSPTRAPTDRQPTPVDTTLSSTRTPSDIQPTPVDTTLSPTRAPTDRQPTSVDTKLSPTRTTTDNQPPLMDTTMSPISLDIGSLQLTTNQPLSSTQTPIDSEPMPVGDKTLLPLSKTVSPIGSTVIDISTGTVPESPQMYKSLLSHSISEDTGDGPLSIDETVSLTPVFETAIVNKSYLIDNLVTPLSETTTFHIKNTSDNGLPHAMEDLPVKMNLGFPTIYDVPFSVDQFPTEVHQDSAGSLVSIADLTMDVDRTLNPLSEVPVSDLVTPTEVLSVPVEVVKVATPSVPSDSYKSIISDSIEEVNQNIPVNKDTGTTYELSGLLLDELNSPMHEVNHRPQYDLPLSVQQPISDFPLSHALSNEPLVKDDSPVPVIDKTPQIPITDTKDKMLVNNPKLIPEGDVCPVNSVTDVPNTVLPSFNGGLQSDYLDKTMLPETPFADVPGDDFILFDKMLPLPDNTPTEAPLRINKIHSASKLPITKALLENVLSGINEGDLSSPLPPRPLSQEDKTVYYVDEKSPLSETEEIPLFLVENTIPDVEHTDNLNNFGPVSKIIEDRPSTDFSSELPFPMDPINKDKSYAPIEDVEVELLAAAIWLIISTDDQLLPKNKISQLTDVLSDISRSETPSSSKLPIAKALLQNVLSDINTKGFSKLVSNPLPATSSSVLDKTRYYLDSPDSDRGQDSTPLPEILPNIAGSHHQTDNSLTYSEQTENPSSMAEKRPLSSSSSRDPQLFPNNNGKTPSSSKLSITKALLENVLMEMNTKSFSIPVSKAFPAPDSDIAEYDIPHPDTTEVSSPLPVAEILSNIAPPDHVINNNLPYPDQSKDLLSLKKDNLMGNPSLDTSAEMISPIDQVKPNSNNDHTSPMAEDLPLSSHTASEPQLFPNNNGETPLSSKLSIMKALLQNVLTEIKTKDFSIPVSKAISATSSSVLDNERYYTDYPGSDIIGDNPPHFDTIEGNPALPVADIMPTIALSDHQLVNNLQYPDLSEDFLLLEDAMLSNIPSLDINKQILSSLDQIVSNLNDDFTSPMEIHRLPQDKPIDKQSTDNEGKTYSSTTLPITKALLENVLTEINTKGFSIPVSKGLPGISSSVLDKTHYHIDSPDSSIIENSTPHLDTIEESAPIPVAEILPNIALSEHQTNNTLPYPEQSEGLLPLEKKRKPSEISSFNISQEESSSLDKIESNILTSPMAEAQSYSKDTPNNKQSQNNKGKISSSAKLLITKALLENVLTEINTKGFSTPVSKALPDTSSSILDKTPYRIEYPDSEIIKDIYPLPVAEILTNIPLSEHQNDNSLPYPEQFEGPLSLEKNKMLSEIPSSDIFQEISLPVDKIQASLKDPSLLNEIPPLPKDADVCLENDPQISKNKIHSSSKLPIAKALLENVLSDINTRGFSSSVAKSLPVATRSQLDKTLYFLESPLPDIVEENSFSDVSKENFAISETNEEVFSLATDTIIPNDPILDISTDESLIDKMFNDESDDLTKEVEGSDETLSTIELTDDTDGFPTVRMFNDDLTEEVEDSDETLFSDQPTDYLDDLSTQMDDRLSLTDDLPDDLPVPQTNQLFSSRLPITKALLEKVLSDINDGAIASNSS